MPIQGQIVLGAQGLVGAMEDACHPEGMEKEEEKRNIDARRVEESVEDLKGG